jgi:hypothetical protein
MICDLCAQRTRMRFVVIVHKECVRIPTHRVFKEFASMICGHCAQTAFTFLLLLREL